MTVKRVAVLFCLFVLAASARAAVPPVISYQGRLLQPSGAAVPDGTVSITFSIYDAPTGGTALWTETNPSVFVKGGLFSVMLGSVTPMPPDIFNGADRYFGIQVGSDAETSPRQKIASAAYAHSAGTAETATTAATATTANVAISAGNGVPVGGVIMWSGATNAIPSGWALCNGQNGTPDLRDRFLVGAGGVYAVGNTGGAASVTLTIAQMPQHSHPIVAGPSQGAGGTNGITVWAADNVIPASTAWPAYAGGNQPHENRPPYYALCFIMKVAG